MGCLGFCFGVFELVGNCLTPSKPSPGLISGPLTFFGLSAMGFSLQFTFFFFFFGHFFGMEIKKFN